jgi:hypothetical protein
LYQREDWYLYLDPKTLLQKAVFFPLYHKRIVLKELADNELDSGANVSLEYVSGQWVVCDDGPGIDPAIVRKLFSVNRSLLSSKLKRFPLRGMLGNGLRVVMGAVAVSGGILTVETRGHRFQLETDRATGETVVVADEPIPRKSGTAVRLSLCGSKDSDAVLAQASIQIAKLGKHYEAPSSPWWYGPGDLLRIFANVTPTNATVGDVSGDLGLKFDDSRIARNITKQEAETILSAGARTRKQSLRRKSVSSDESCSRIGRVTHSERGSPRHKAVPKSLIWRKLGSFVPKQAKRGKAAPTLKS